MTEAARDREFARFTSAYAAQAVIGLLLVLRGDLLLRLWVDRRPEKTDARPRKQ